MGIHSFLVCNPLPSSSQLHIDSHHRKLQLYSSPCPLLCQPSQPSLSAAHAAPTTAAISDQPQLPWPILTPHFTSLDSRSKKPPLRILLACRVVNLFILHHRTHFLTVDADLPFRPLSKTVARPLCSRRSGYFCDLCDGSLAQDGIYVP